MMAILNFFKRHLLPNRKSLAFVVICHVSAFSNIFSSETTGPIEVKFHMEHPLDGGTKVFWRGPGHMTKMAAMPI